MLIITIWCLSIGTSTWSLHHQTTRVVKRLSFTFSLLNDSGFLFGLFSPHLALYALCGTKNKSKQYLVFVSRNAQINILIWAIVWFLGLLSGYVIQYSSFLLLRSFLQPLIHTLSLEILNIAVKACKPVSIQTKEFFLTIISLMEEFTSMFQYWEPEKQHCQNCRRHKKTRWCK